MEYKYDIKRENLEIGILIEHNLSAPNGKVYHSRAYYLYAKCIERQVDCTEQAQQLWMSNHYGVEPYFCAAQRKQAIGR